MKRESIDAVFWKNVKETLAEKGLTVAWLQRELGVNPGFVRTAVSQKSLPQPRNIEKIAEVLDVDYWVLFDEGK